LGHRQIGFIQQQPNHTTSRLRLDGYRAALQADGLTPDPALVVACQSGHQGGSTAAEALLARRPDITAIFAHNDVIALGVIHALREAKLSVPEDISVVSYDDIDSAAFYEPPLTTVSYPKEAMATSAARQLFTLMENDEKPPMPQTELLPVRLIVRQSTGPVR